MSSKVCSRCEKTVYPLEELKCLDKVNNFNLGLTIHLDIKKLDICPRF